MSVHRKWILSWFNGLPGWLKPALLVAMLLLLNARWELPEKLTIPALLAAWTGAIGVVGIAAVYPLVSRSLAYPVFRWLGRVSYSLYLTHVIVLFAVVYLTRGVLPLPVALLIALSVSLLLSEAYYRLAEVTSTRLGRILARRVEADAELVSAAAAP